MKHLLKFLFIAAITIATNSYADQINTSSLYTNASGSYTPVLTFGGASTGITYGTQLGYWQRIGNLAVVCVNITLTSKGTSTGPAVISMPFASANNGIYQGGNSIAAFSMTGVTGSVITLVTPNSSNLNLYMSGNGAATGLTNSAFTNTSILDACTSYIVQ